MLSWEHDTITDQEIGDLPDHGNRYRKPDDLIDSVNQAVSRAKEDLFGGWDTDMDLIRPSLDAPVSQSECLAAIEELKRDVTNVGLHRRVQFVQTFRNSEASYREFKMWARLEAGHEGQKRKLRSLYSKFQQVCSQSLQVKIQELVRKQSQELQDFVLVKNNPWSAHLKKPTNRRPHVTVTGTPEKLSFEIASRIYAHLDLESCVKLRETSAFWYSAFQHADLEYPVRRRSPYGQLWLAAKFGLGDDTALYATFVDLAQPGKLFHRPDRCLFVPLALGMSSLRQCSRSAHFVTARSPRDQILVDLESGTQTLVRNTFDAFGGDVEEPWERLSLRCHLYPGFEGDYFDARGLDEKTLSRYEARVGGDSYHERWLDSTEYGGFVPQFRRDTQDLNEPYEFDDPEDSDSDFWRGEEVVCNCPDCQEF
ncbi:hypothetical protein CJU89_6793 [Yarrowia sp. B02]|nr:hypothetical protein CJU89_6793 [Yarrowia sp. B02]